MIDPKKPTNWDEDSRFVEIGAGLEIDRSEEEGEPIDFGVSVDQD